jgi:hypothetical protein
MFLRRATDRPWIIPEESSTLTFCPKVLLTWDQGNYSFVPGKYKVMHVDETSACLDRTTKYINKYPRACDHLSMNKFSSPNHPEWEVMTRVLHDMESGKWKHGTFLAFIMTRH